MSWNLSLRGILEARQHFKRGQYLAWQGIYVDACQAFAQSVRLRPSSGALAHWALSLNNLENFSEALAKIQEARGPQPQNSAYQLFEALVRLEMADHDGAEALVQEVRALHPQNQMASNLASLLRFRRGQTREALEILEQDGLCDNLDIRARLMIELIGATHGVDSARPSQGPGRPSSRPAPACCRAANWLRAKWMYDRGIRHLQRGRSQEALECLEEAEARFPALPGLSYHLGVALFQLGEIEQAREKFEKMVPGDFYSAPASFYHALCRQQMGFLEEAQASLLGLEGRQDLYDFQEYLAYFLGVNFLKRSDPKKARTYFRKALGRWSPLLEEQLLETLRRCREGQSPKMAGAG